MSSNLLWILLLVGAPLLMILMHRGGHGGMGHGHGGRNPSGSEPRGGHVGHGEPATAPRQGGAADPDRSDDPRRRHGGC